MLKIDLVSTYREDFMKDLCDWKNPETESIYLDAQFWSPEIEERRDSFLLSRFVFYSANSQCLKRR